MHLGVHAQNIGANVLHSGKVENAEGAIRRVDQQINVAVRSGLIAGHRAVQKQSGDAQGLEAVATLLEPRDGVSAFHYALTIARMPCAPHI